MEKPQVVAKKHYRILRQKVENYILTVHLLYNFALYLVRSLVRLSADTFKTLWALRCQLSSSAASVSLLWVSLKLLFSLLHREHVHLSLAPLHGLINNNRAYDVCEMRPQQRRMDAIFLKSGFASNFCLFCTLSSLLFVLVWRRKMHAKNTMTNSSLIVIAFRPCAVQRGP